jgi:hypothetical protein
MKVTDGKKTIEVTEKAYRVIYAPMGYRPVEENDEKKSATKRTIK